MIDREKLMEYRKRTVISGVYLNAWNIVNKHLLESGNIKLDDYVVAFDEDEKFFLVTFSKPFAEPVLGGGVGTCTVDKKTQEVSCKLIR